MLGNLRALHNSQIVMDGAQIWSAPKINRHTLMGLAMSVALTLLYGIIGYVALAK